MIDTQALERGVYRLSCVTRAAVHSDRVIASLIKHETEFGREDHLVPVTRKRDQLARPGFRHPARYGARGVEPEAILEAMKALNNLLSAAGVALASRRP